MAARRELSAFERGMIVGARRMGASISDVANTLQFSRTTVARVYREYTQRGVTTHVGQRTGRPRLVDARGVRRVTRLAAADRRATAAQITMRYNQGRPTTVSVTTIRRTLAFSGFGSRRPRRVPLLTAAHRQQRLAWANQHRHWTAEDWRRVAWSDESRFQLYRADGRVRVWRRPHEAMDPACQVGTTQAGGGSILVWGVFSWHAMGPLVHLTSTLRATSYVDLLGDYLHPFMNCFYPAGDGTFQQDNAPPHTALVTRQWLEEHATDFTTMIWPPRSPDCNPIEHLWDVLERSVRSSPTELVNAASLWRAVEAAWLAVPVDVFRGLVDSLPRRVAAVIRARGGPTCY